MIQGTPRVFLSHNHRDKEFARRLARDLTARGSHVWLDEAVMFLGDSLISKIEGAIEQADYFAVILSRRSANSDWVRREIDVAMNQGVAGRKIELLPLLIEDCEVPTTLDGILLADFRVPEQYDKAFDLVARRIGLADHPSPMLKSMGVPWPLPDSAFAPVRVLKLHIAFYDGHRFNFGDDEVSCRLTTGDSGIIDRFLFASMARFYDLRPGDVAECQVAHYESKSWLRFERTFGQEGVASGDHLICALHSSAAVTIDDLVSLFASVLQDRRAG